MRTAVTPVGRPVRGVPPANRQRKAVVKSRPPPVGGWNARDSLADMPPTDAVLLDNWFPEQGKVSVRGGHTSHATGVGSGNVEFIMEYHSGTSRKMLAAGGGSIYDATNTGAATSKASGFSSNRWQGVNFNGRLGMVNGTDAVQIYDGSTVSAMTISGSGLTTANLIGINVFKSRTYFWEDNSQDFWYSAVNALGGALTKFPLSRVGQFGGNLIAMGTWTLDGGAGVDDLAVFVMSSGEIVIYEGSNPGDAADWNKKGIFRVGAPLAVRGVVKFGGDLIVMSKDGYLPLSRVISLGQLNRTGAISDKISGAVIEAATNFSANFGWQAILYPRGSMMLFNVPRSATVFEQHVVNTVTGAWCRFTGMNAHAWGLFNDRIYFGAGDGVVHLADDSKADAGSDITADVETAFDYMDSPGILKHVTALGPVLGGSGDLAMSLSVQADFQESTSQSLSYTLTTGAASEELWEDITDLWEASTIEFVAADRVARKWFSAKGNGYAIGIRMKVTGQQSANWFSTNYMMSPGGLI